MAAAFTQSRANRATRPVGDRLATLLACQTPETLAQLERFLSSRRGPRADESARSPFNLTIQEVALLSSFRGLPDEASREAAANGVAAFRRFISNARHATALGRLDRLCCRVRKAAR
jgi:hypothetical protein